MMERPRDRDDTGFNIVRAADLAEQINQAQVAAEARFVELHCAATPIVLWECGDAFGAHLASQQS